MATSWNWSNPSVPSSYQPTEIREEAPRVRIPPARPDEYTAWLTEGLIAIGDMNWRDMGDLNNKKIWPYVAYENPDDFANVGCVLGHIQIVDEYDHNKMERRKSIRIMSAAKDYLENNK